MNVDQGNVGSSRTSNAAIRGAPRFDMLRGMWMAFWLGLAVGVAVAIPLAGAWGRRTAQRVRQLEARARTAERLAEIGTMTSGLAHEIKNPLSTLGLNLQLLQEDMEEIEQAARDGQVAEPEKIGRVQRRFDALQREAHRLREILEDFLRFAGRIKLHREPTDLHQVITDLVDFFEPQAMAAGVTLRTQLDANPSTLEADTGLLKQALLNLLINATQAMQQAREKNLPHGGANLLMVRTHRQRQLNEDRLVLDVIDTGPGMPEDVAGKVFQPYFSTKAGGTGLGLPTTRRIIEEHGGSITLHTEPGRGTDFAVTLPTTPSPNPTT